MPGKKLALEYGAMRHGMRTVAVLIALGAGTGTGAEPWPHWRGPHGNGSSDDRAVPLRWSPLDNVRWKLPLPGVSGSTPVVWGERLYLSVSDGEAISLWAVSRADGDVLWKRPLSGGDESKRKGNLSSPSPVTDGERVWAMTGTGVLRAFDRDGGQIWNRDFQADYGRFGILHGYASSPLLRDDRLYVQVLHGFHTDDPSYVVALDAGTGETLWRVERPTDAPREAPDAYTTPAALERADGWELIVSGADYVTGHDPATGRELWRVGGLNPRRNPMQRIVASPVVLGDLLLAPSRVDPLTALDASAEGRPAVLWRVREGPDVPTPVMNDRHVFVLRDGGIMLCLDAATGATVWGPERLEGGTYSASPVLAGDRVYVTSESGTTTVLAATDRFEVLAVNRLDEYILSSLAVSDGQIFLRTSEHLYCLEDGETRSLSRAPRRPAQCARPPR